MATLHLNLKRKWFDMIAKGEKTEEYRDIKETILRLIIDKNKASSEEALVFCNSCKKKSANALNRSIGYFSNNGKKFDTITFSNGYRKGRDQFVIELKGIKIDTGKASWGASVGVFYIVLELGRIIEKNY